MFRSVIAGATCAGLLLATAGTAAAAPPVEFNADWGGVDQTAYYHHENLCQKERIEPGGSRPARLPILNSGRRVASSYFRNSVVNGTLICAPELEIWAHRQGPWDEHAPGGPNWLSIRCPHSEIPADNGAGFWASERHLTQVSGGFGSGRDGYWHYRFHNWTSNTARIQFWAVCINPSTERPF